MQALNTVQNLMTVHGRKRMDARRIPPEGIEAALDWGSTWRTTKDRSCQFVRLDRRALDRAKQTGVDLRAFEGITVILGSDCSILTVYRNREGFRVWR